MTKTNGGSDVIGTIRPNEVFIWTHGWNGNEAAGSDFQGISFKNSSNIFVNGWLNGATDIGGLTPLTKCSLYDLDLGLGHGVESIFQTRIAVSKFNTSGKQIGTLPANYFVVTKNGTCGATNKKLMHISACGAPDNGPEECDCFINVCSTSMLFNSFALKGQLR